MADDTSAAGVPSEQLSEGLSNDPSEHLSEEAPAGPGRPVPVLVYHRVDRSGEPYTTTPEVFRRHVAWLADHGYRTVTTDDLDRAVTDPAADLPDRPVVLTFDDGYACLETEVAPTLQQRHFTGVSFLITGRMGDADRLSWSGARDLAAEGVLEFHSHSHSHGMWDLGPATAATVHDDLARSRRELAAHLERPASSFTHLAWPYGRTCPEWETAADRLGFGVQYVVQRGAVDRWYRTHRLPRLLADGMAPAALAAWMRALSRRRGARATNRVFGSIRQVRRGAAYR